MNQGFTAAVMLLALLLYLIVRTSVDRDDFLGRAGQRCHQSTKQHMVSAFAARHRLVLGQVRPRWLHHSPPHSNQRTTTDSALYPFVTNFFTRSP
jgi:hypothetical protein